MGIFFLSLSLIELPNNSELNLDSKTIEQALVYTLSLSFYSSFLTWTQHTHRYGHSCFATMTMMARALEVSFQNKSARTIKTLITAHSNPNPNL